MSLVVDIKCKCLQLSKRNCSRDCYQYRPKRPLISAHPINGSIDELLRAIVRSVWVDTKPLDAVCEQIAMTITCVKVDLRTAGDIFGRCVLS